ncbi:hypothetical protein AB2881_30560, partial [Escherichia coli]
MRSLAQTPRRVTPGRAVYFTLSPRPALPGAGEGGITAAERCPTPATLSARSPVAGSACHPGPS